MFGASSKLGRGSGAGRGAANKRPHMPPPRAAASRLPRGGAAVGARSRAAAAPAVEESFSLVSGSNPPAFAMLIRLAPDLVDEIRRLEAQAGTARIKFDPFAANPSVIDVGGKEFRFTWSRETGDLCDIYEERQSGEDGDGLLVESGCAWRKLNVQRILDESTTNHVKKLSEEAERIKDSRRSIVLDPGNPSMKSQIKQLAAVETNPWKHFKNKKEPPPKKRKIEPPQGPIHKPAFKSGILSSSTVKARHSLSPPEQSGPAASPLRTINFPKSNASADDATTHEFAVKVKANVVSREVIERKSNVGAKLTDLQTMLVNLLTENPKGMSMRGLERSIGDSFPNSVKQIEAILKRIAIFQAPGRYLLKSETDSESFKKPWSGSRSSPEENLHQTPAREDNHDQIPAPEPDSRETVPSNEFDENPKLDEEPNTIETIDILQHSPDLSSERKISDNIEKIGSDSDSESDSSDSGSKSSSDSDSDRSANSKEGSDEDVDIMSDDDKEPKQLEFLAPGNFGPEHNHVEISKDMPDEKPETGIAVGGISTPLKEYQTPVEKTNSSSPDHDVLQQRQNFIGSLFDEGNNVVSSGFEQTDSSERASKGKYKKGMDMKLSGEKSEHAKRAKTGNSGQPPFSSGRDVDFQHRPQKPLSDKLTEDSYQGLANQASHEADVDGKGVCGKSTTNTQKSGKRSIDHSALPKPSNSSKKPENPSESRKSVEGFPSLKGKLYKDTPHEDGHAKEKVAARNIKESGGKSKKSTLTYPHVKKSKTKDVGQVSVNDIIKISVDRSPVANGRANKLQREYSDLELGELREPVPEEIPVKKQFERKSSFKQSENKPGNLDYWAPDTSRENHLEGSNKKRNLDDRAEDLSRSQRRFHPRVDTADFALPSNKLMEANGGKLGNPMEGYGESNRKAPSQYQVDTKREKVSNLARERKSSNLADGNTELLLAEGNNGDRKRRDSSSDENSCSYSKYEKDEPDRKGPIKDFLQYKEYVQEYRDKYDSYCSLNKILDSYRNEFQKLGKELELAKGRNTDRYYSVLEQLKESYRQSGTRHKRLKKIFVVLHEELKHLKERIKDFAASYSKD